jgi:hypothetical protein
MAQADTSLLRQPFPEKHAAPPPATLKASDTLMPPVMPATAPAESTRRHIPRKATIRSALIPGWGQAYNREYWKIPIVYGALAIPVATFLYNNKWYKKTKFAYEAKFKASVDPNDTADLALIDPRIASLSIGSLQTYRSIFRRDRDYSVLWFVILWGVNVVDATVFAHLKEFDVSDNLSLQVNPTLSPNTKGISLSLGFKKPEKKVFSVR